MIRRRRGDELVPADYWWTPYNVNTLGILDEMDRLFDDFRTGFENSMVMPRRLGVQAIRTPAVDLIDEGGTYRLLAEMPGVRKEDITIEIGENEVQISAEAKEEKMEGNEGGYIRRERCYSRISRHVSLPDAVRTDNSSAEMKDGLLTIILPKASKSMKKSRKVEVK